MAKTYIGNLVLQLQENVSAGAKKAAGALKGLDAAARNIGKGGGGAERLKTSVDSLNAALHKTGAAPWGAKLQQQFERLGATSKDLDKLRTSWAALNLQMQGVGGRMRHNALAEWRVQTLSSLAAVKAKMRETETAAHQMQRAIANGLKPMGYAAGLGGGIYGGSRVISNAAKASATYEDLKLALDQKNWGAEAKGKILAEADRLAARWGQSRATALETLMDAAISSDKPLDALKKSETYGRSLVLENLYSGPDQAADGVRNLDKARDSLGIEKPEDVKRFFDNYYRAKSILGKDLNTDQYRQAVQMARTAGKAADMEFLATTLRASSRSPRAAMRAGSFVPRSTSLWPAERQRRPRSCNRSTVSETPRAILSAKRSSGIRSPGSTMSSRRSSRKPVS